MYLLLFSILKAFFACIGMQESRLEVSWQATVAL